MVFLQIKSVKKKTTLPSTVVTLYDSNQIRTPMGGVLIKKFEKGVAQV